MALPRRALLLAFVLVVTPAMAGCSVADWYNQTGHVRIQLDVQGGSASSLDEFRSVKAAIYGVSMKQRDALNPDHYSFGDQPLIVDLVTHGREQEPIPLTEFSANLRAIETVIVRIVVFEAIDAAGVPMEICRLTTQPEKFPCFYQPDSNILIYEEKPFSAPRGGTIVVHFPVSIKYAQQGRISEYFLFADPSLILLENQR